MATPGASSIDIVIVGAGQAGLIVSKLLSEAGREHVLLERRSTLGGAWQDRWDTFRLVSPNWTASVRGYAYQGDDPDGFMTRDEVVSHFRGLAAAIHAPVELDTEVRSLKPLESEARSGGRGRPLAAARFRIETSGGTFLARTAIVAAGPFQVPHLPPMSVDLDPAISQVNVHAYRRAGQLPPGGVLIVGSGQSGVQLAEELHAAGRAVTIAVGKCPRFPRTYRGRDVFWWLRQLATAGPSVGATLPTAAMLPDPRRRLACNPQLSGHGQPHDIDLRLMAASGIRLAGRLVAVEGTRVRFAPDLAASLTFADRAFEERWQPAFDRFAAATGLGLPPDSLSSFAYDPPEIADLDLAAEG
ncbi:MAG TPA: NAD(P)-binding domain-containing protein, partial [Candidatus Binatus sp.]|nr:NAD(P)-binding domain-containing protein [Candidatus Binatus sp.]